MCTTIFELLPFRRRAKARVWGLGSTKVYTLAASVESVHTDDRRQVLELFFQVSTRRNLARDTVARQQEPTSELPTILLSLASVRWLARFTEQRAVKLLEPPRRSRKECQVRLDLGRARPFRFGSQSMMFFNLVRS